MFLKNLKGFSMKKLSLLVICSDADNVFVKELKKYKVDFYLADSVRYQQWEQTMTETLKGKPDVILLVNKSVADGLSLKRYFGFSEVLVCAGGGQKDFQPYVVRINLNEDHNYYNYTDWQEFISFVRGNFPEIDKQLKLIRKGVYEFNEKWEGALPKARDLQHNWQAMLRAAIAYLEWLTGWLSEVGLMEFSCQFNYLVKKKIKQLTIKLPPIAMVHRGKEIFKEDQVIDFKLKSGKSGLLLAVIKSVTEESITVNFLTGRLATEQINQIISFKLIVDKVTPQFLATECKKWLFQTNEESITNPMGFISGLSDFYEWYKEESQDNLVNQLNILPTEMKILRDQSQITALQKIFNSRPVVLIQGPPGTGKTFVTALAIKQLLSLKKVILVTSHSNQGLDNILNQVVALLPKEDHSKIFRLGNHLNIITPSAQPFHRETRYQRPPVPKGAEPDENTRSLTNEELAGLEFSIIKEKLDKNQGVILFVTINSFTTDETMNRLIGNHVQPEITFVDEATKSLIYEVLPIIRETKQKMIFVGDTLQLGNIGIPEDAKKHIELAPNIEWQEIDYFVEGLFYSLIKKRLLPDTLLKTNRRSLRKIALLISQVFYSGQLTVGRFNPWAEGSITWLDTRRLSDNLEKKKNTSYYNPVEKNLAVKQFIGLVKRHLKQGGKITDCAIITPYQAQIHLIRQALRKDLLFNQEIQKSGQVNVNNIDSILSQVVNTVDAFQGSERYGIVLSLVRSNHSGEIGFNRDLRRLNVALSRAQDELIIIGNSDTFTNCFMFEVKEVFQKIMTFVKQEGKYLELK